MNTDKFLKEIDRLYILWKKLQNTDTDEERSVWVRLNERILVAMELGLEVSADKRWKWMMDLRMGK